MNPISSQLSGYFDIDVVLIYILFLWRDRPWGSVRCTDPLRRIHHTFLDESYLVVARTPILKKPGCA